MDKTTQDLTWSVLPKEFKEEVKKIYCTPGYCAEVYTLLQNLFRAGNLTSDEEGEEMLTCEKYRVEEALNYCDELDSNSGSHNMLNWGKQIIAYLFGSKCLLDAREDNFTRTEPKPSEPKLKYSYYTYALL